MDRLLGGPQMLTLGSALMGGTLLLNLGVPLGLVAAVVLAAGVLGLVRVGGRPLVEWVPSMWRWCVRRRRGATWVAPLPAINATPSATLTLPPPLDAQVVTTAPRALAEAWHQEFRSDGVATLAVDQPFRLERGFVEL